MVWLQFISSSVIIVLAAMKLAEYGDVIAERTGLGRMFIGTLLMAGATSLPEFLTTISSINQSVPDLAAGNMMGSCMFNMFLLAVMDLLFWRRRILRRVAMKHALTASLALWLIGLTTFFLLAQIEVKIGWVGLDSLALVASYLAGVWLIRQNSSGATGGVPEPAAETAGLPGLVPAGLGFLAATVVLIVVTPWLVSSSAAIAEITGIGSGFIGTALVSVITSLPEVVTTIAAIRLGAYDLAVGNLFGSNMFNIFALALADFFFLPGRFLAIIDPTFALVGLLALALTTLGLIGNLARLERRFLILELDALLLILVYVIGMGFLYSRGLGL